MKKAIQLLMLTSALAPAQELSAGKLLVASTKVQDADFARTVILLIRSDEQGAIGLFVNRPSNIPVSEVYPDLKGSQLKLYTGGPVTIGIRALYRSHTQLDQAKPIFPDVSMISTKTLLGKMVVDGTPSSIFRVYAGYVGWTGVQLNDEVARGLWLVRPGDANIVFDPHPETLWSRLADHFKIRNIFEKSSVHTRNPVYGFRTCPARYRAGSACCTLGSVTRTQSASLQNESSSDAS